MWDIVWVSPQGHRWVWSPPVGTYGIHSVVGISNFAKYREIRPVTVWEILINLLKPAIPQWWEKWESDWNLYPGTNHHQKLIVYRESPLVHAYHVWSTSISAIMSYPAYRISGLFRRVPKCIQYKLCILVHRCLHGAAPQNLSPVDLAAVRCRLTICIHGWSSSVSCSALNHRRPCSCHRWSTCLEQSSSRSAPSLDIFYFQNTPEVTSVQHIIPFSLTVALTTFVQSPWSRLCCIHLSKFVIITLHYRMTKRPITPLSHCQRLVE